MITLSTLPQADQPSPRAEGGFRVASIDVEWTKNYRVRGGAGNVPFCYSITWLQVPDATAGSVRLEHVPVHVLSRYVESTDETRDLVEAAARDLHAAFIDADLIVGHQLSSDLAVLRTAGTLRDASADSLQVLETARTAWHARRAGSEPGTGEKPRRGSVAAVIDTRYDADAVLHGTSRRLVDVCTELELDVTQPELLRTSMTALHRRWLDAGDRQARERITVLNVRHGLSAAHVALLARRTAAPRSVSVNAILAETLHRARSPREGTTAAPTSSAELGGGALAWLRDPAFTALLSTETVVP